jgi:hypothetical protein
LPVLVEKSLRVEHKLSLPPMAVSAQKRSAPGLTAYVDIAPRLGRWKGNEQLSPLTQKFDLPGSGLTVGALSGQHPQAPLRQPI